MPDSMEQLSLVIDGPAFRDYYPAEPVSEITLAFERILRRAMANRGPRRGAAPARLRLLASYPRPGSYVQEFTVVWELAQKLIQPLAPLVPDVIKSISNAIELLKLLVPEFAPDQHAPLVSTGDGGRVVIVQNHYEINADAFFLIGDTANTLASIARNIGDEITEFTGRGTKGESFSVNRSDAEVLGTREARDAARRIHEVASDLKLSTSAEPNALSATVEVLSFDKNTRTGRLRVIQSRDLANREYIFFVGASPRVAEIIRGMLLAQIRVSLQRITRAKLLIVEVQGGNLEQL